MGVYVAQTNPENKERPHRILACYLSAVSHVNWIGSSSLSPTWSGLRCCFGQFRATPARTRSQARAVPAGNADEVANIKKRLGAHFLNREFGRNIPKPVWRSHQQQDEFLGPIYRYLTSNASTPVTEFTAHLRTRAQSYRMIGNLLYYRAIREVGVFNPDEGWVIAVPEKAIFEQPS